MKISPKFKDRLVRIELSQNSQIAKQIGTIFSCFIGIPENQKESTKIALLFHVKQKPNFEITDALEKQLRIEGIDYREIITVEYEPILDVISL